MSKYKIAYTSKFKEQRKLMIARGFDITELDKIIELLANGTPLPEKHHDHSLQGSRKGYRDCHIRPDWVLIHKIEEDILTLLLCEIGSHSNIFGLAK